MDFSIRVSLYKRRLFWLVSVLVGIRLLILFLGLGSQGIGYIFCQTVFTIAWAMVACFMLQCSFRFQANFYEEFQEIQMRKTSFYAMIACLARVIVYAIYKWPMISFDPDTNQIFVWPTIHNLLEELVWLLLAIFFYYYWMARRYPHGK